MEVFVSNKQDFLSIAEKSVSDVAAEVLQLENQMCDELSIYFVTREGISRLHQQYFNDPSPTDCISFPMDDQSESGYKVLGDIFICPETAKEFLAQSNEPTQIAIYQETTLYLVHGLLHLLGYDDINDRDRQDMRNAEQRIMSHLTLRNLFLAPAV